MISIKFKYVFCEGKQPLTSDSHFVIFEGVFIFIYVYSSQWSCEVKMMIPIVQGRKLRLEEVKA